jgi:hypothetical protein
MGRNEKHRNFQIDENSQFSASEPETNYQFLNEIEKAKSLESQSDQFARRTSMLSEEDQKYRAYIAQQALPKIEEEEEGTPGLKRNISFNPNAFKSAEENIETLETDDHHEVIVVDSGGVLSP